MRIVGLLLSLSLFLSCKKDIAGQSEAFFQVSHFCGVRPQQDTLKYIDSTIFFHNSSVFDNPIDSTANNNFKWDFGDGSTSTAISPTHKYTSPGTYTITLTTFVNGRESNRLSKTTDVLCGQKQVKPLKQNFAIDMDRTAESGAMILTWGFTDAGVYGYYLAKVNKNLQTLWVKNITTTNSQIIKFFSIKRINDVSFIISGNYGDEVLNTFCVSKIDSSGNLLWKKSIPDILGINTYTMPTSDGGFVTIGATKEAGQEIIMVVKLNTTGDELWRKKIYNVSSNRFIDKVIEVNNNYLFPAVLNYESNGYPILITKLGQDGQVIKQDSSVRMQNPSSNLNIAYTSGRFIIPGQYYFHLYDDNLTYVSTGQAPIGSLAFTEGFNGSFYSAATGDYQTVKKINLNGQTEWAVSLNSRIPNSCYGFSAGTARPTKMVLLVNNEVWVLGQGITNLEYPESSSVLLEKFTLDGVKR